MRHLFDGDAPLAEPFPSPGPSGPSLGEGGWLDCNGTGDPPLDDAAATLQILNATAPGGADRLARIRVRLSTPAPLAGYSGRVLIDPAAAAAVPWGDGDIQVGVQKGIDLTHNPNLGSQDQGRFPADVWFSSTRLDGDILSFAYLDPPPSKKDPIQGESVEVLEIVVCLAAGTRAGVYPLTLVDGELVDRGSARSIRPRLEGGTLTVLEDMTATGECPGEFPPNAAAFVRGDANGDGKLSVSDVHFSSLARFDLRAWPECWMAMDVNDDGNSMVGIWDGFSATSSLQTLHRPGPSLFRDRMAARTTSSASSLALPTATAARSRTPWRGSRCLMPSLRGATRRW